ncbi:9829_t:CDS:2, partial [Gigaspora rosea]
SEISYKHYGIYFQMFLYYSETEIYVQLHRKVCGARVKRCEYKSYGSTQLFIITDGYEFVNVTKNWHIDHFVGVLNIDKLPVVPLQKECEIRDELLKRGIKMCKKFEMLAICPHYLRYYGKFFRQPWFGPTYYKGDGRIMIDASIFGLSYPNYDMGLANYNPATY